jgi:hypothetical protein
MFVVFDGDTALISNSNNFVTSQVAEVPFYLKDPVAPLQIYVF